MGDLYLAILLWALGVLHLVHHWWVLQLLPLLFIFLALKRLGEWGTCRSIRYDILVMNVSVCDSKTLLFILKIFAHKKSFVVADLCRWN